MRNFQCFLFVLKRSYICYYIICMTLPLSRFLKNFPFEKTEYKQKLKDVWDYVA